MGLCLLPIKMHPRTSKIGLTIFRAERLTVSTSRGFATFKVKTVHKSHIVSSDPQQGLAVCVCVCTCMCKHVCVPICACMCMYVSVCVFHLCKDPVPTAQLCLLSASRSNSRLGYSVKHQQGLSVCQVNDWPSLLVKCVCKSFLSLITL